MIKLNVLDKTEILFLKKGELVPLENIEMSGYVFNGWTDGRFYIVEPEYVNGKAEFSADLYDASQSLVTVTFKFGNGKKNMVVKVPMNSEIPMPPRPTKNGYRCIGWYDEKKHKLNYGILEVGMSDTSFRAEWEKE